MNITIKQTPSITLAFTAQLFLLNDLNIIYRSKNLQLCHPGGVGVVTEDLKKCINEQTSSNL